MLSGALGVLVSADAAAGEDVRVGGEQAGGHPAARRQPGHSHTRGRSEACTASALSTMDLIDALLALLPLVPRRRWRNQLKHLRELFAVDCCGGTRPRTATGRLVPASRNGRGSRRRRWQLCGRHHRRPVSKAWRWGRCRRGKVLDYAERNPDQDDAGGSAAEAARPVVAARKRAVIALSPGGAGAVCVIGEFFAAGGVLSDAKSFRGSTMAAPSPRGSW